MICAALKARYLGKTLRLALLVQITSSGLQFLQCFKFIFFFLLCPWGLLSWVCLKRICKADAKAKTLGKTLYYTKSMK